MIWLHYWLRVLERFKNLDVYDLCAYNINMDHTRKKPVNISIREDLMKEARALNLNISRAAENGLDIAVREAKEKNWRVRNQDAIDSHNRRIENQGLYLNPIWEE